VTLYATVEDVLVIHATLIARFGGAPGIRDRRALEAALARLQTGYYDDLLQEAAALWESLSQNHPFVDGNKRTAVTVTAAFLTANGYFLKFNDADAFSFLNGLYETGRVGFQELDRWLRQHAVPRSAVE
jgi:death-on-curing protein